MTFKLIFKHRDVNYIKLNYIAPWKSWHSGALQIGLLLLLLYYNILDDVYIISLQANEATTASFKVPLESGSHSDDTNKNTSRTLRITDCRCRDFQNLIRTSLSTDMYVVKFFPEIWVRLCEHDLTRKNPSKKSWIWMRMPMTCKIPCP